MIAKAKAQPGTVIYGTELGGFSHLQGLMFAKQAGVQLKIVDVGSASDKITSLLGGRIDLASISFGPVKDYAATGDMVMLAQYSKERNPLLGDIKTFNEQGIKFDMEKPYIIAFPKGTNPAIIKKMADVMQQITKDPAYAKALEQGFKQPVTFYQHQGSHRGTEQGARRAHAIQGFAASEEAITVGVAPGDARCGAHSPGSQPFSRGLAMGYIKKREFAVGVFFLAVGLGYLYMTSALPRKQFIDAAFVPYVLAITMCVLGVLQMWHAHKLVASEQSRRGRQGGLSHRRRKRSG